MKKRSRTILPLLLFFLSSFIFFNPVMAKNKDKRVLPRSDNVILSSSLPNTLQQNSSTSLFGKLGGSILLMDEELESGVNLSEMDIQVTQQLNGKLPGLGESFTYWVRSADANSPQPILIQGVRAENQPDYGASFVWTVDESALSSSEGVSFNLLDYISFGLDTQPAGTYHYKISALLPEAGASALPDTAVYLITVNKRQTGDAVYTYEPSISKAEENGYLEANIEFNNTTDLNSFSIPGTIRVDYIGKDSGTSLNGYKFFAALNSTKDADSGQINQVGVNGISDKTGKVLFPELNSADLKNAGISSPGEYVIEISQDPAQNGQYFDEKNQYLYDKHVYQLILEVTENDSGKLSVTSVRSNGSPVFYVDPGLEVLNIVNGSEETNLSSVFTLSSSGSNQLYLLDNNGLNQLKPENGVYRFTLGSNDSVKIFGLRPGTDFEINPESVPEGYTVNVEPKQEDLNSQSAKGRVNLTGANKVSFTLREVNGTERTSQGIGVNIQGSTTLKTAEGSEIALSDKNFSFKITPNQENPLEDPVPKGGMSVYNAADGSINYFKDSLFIREGHYEYTITESDAFNIANIIRDPSIYHVVIDVTNENGLLNAAYSITKEGALFKYRRTIDFENTFAQSVSGVSYSVSGEVMLKLAELKDQAFRFKIEAVDSDSRMYLPNDTIVSNVGSTINFPNMIFDKAGVYTYRVRQVIPEETNGIIYDKAVYTVQVTVEKDGNNNLTRRDYITDETGEECSVVFENELGPESDTAFEENRSAVKLTGKVTVKDISGENHEIKDDQFSFRLTPDTANYGDPVGKTINISAKADGTFSLLENVLFKKAGTYRYTVKENPSKVDGITADETVYEITIIAEDQKSPQILVTKNNESSFEPDSTNTIEFVNIYTSAKKEVESQSSVVISGQSLYNNEAPGNGEYSYSIKAVSPADAPLPEPSSVSNAGGEFAFKPILFKEAGTYTYVLREIEGNNPSILYDYHKYKLQVNVTEEDSSLVARWNVVGTNGEDLGQGIQFKNFDIRKAGMIKTQSIVQTESGKNYKVKSGEFDFTIEPIDDQQDNPVKACTVTNDKNGNVNLFTGAVFPEGQYTYRVKQAAGVAPKMDYDTASYIYTITSYEGSNSISVTDELTGESVNNPVFINHFNDVQKTEQPQIKETVNTEDKEDTKQDKDKDNKDNTSDKTDKEDKTQTSKTEGKLSLRLAQKINGKNADTSIKAEDGDIISYTLTAKNDTEMMAASVRIKDEVPSGLEIDKDSISKGGNYSDSAVHWSIPTLAAGDTYNMSFEAKVNESDAQNPILNTATLTTNDDDPIESNSVSLNLNKMENDTSNIDTDDSDSDSADSKDVTISKTQALGDSVPGKSPLLIEAGDTITYRILVTNNSDKSISGLVIQDMIAPGLIIIDEGGGTIVRNSSGDNIVWDIGELKSNGSITVTFKVEVPDLEDDEVVIYSNTGYYWYSENGENLVESNEVIASNDAQALVNSEEDPVGSGSSNQNNSDNSTSNNTTNSSGSENSQDTGNSNTNPSGTANTIQQGTGNVVTRQDPVGSASAGTTQQTSSPQVIRTVTTTQKDVQTAVTGNAKTGIVEDITLWLVGLLFGTGVLLLNLYCFNRHRERRKLN